MVLLPLTWHAAQGTGAVASPSALTREHSRLTKFAAWLRPWNSPNAYGREGPSLATTRTHPLQRRVMQRARPIDTKRQPRVRLR